MSLKSNSTSQALTSAVARKEKIQRVRFAWDSRLKMSHTPSETKKGEWEFMGLPAENLEFE